MRMTYWISTQTKQSTSTVSKMHTGCSPTTQECMTEFTVSLPVFQEATEVKQVSSFSEDDSPRPLLLNPELEPRATALLVQLLAPSTPCQERGLGSWIMWLSFYISPPISRQYQSIGWMKQNAEEIEIPLCGLQSCAFWTMMRWKALKSKLGNPGQQKGRQQKTHRWHVYCKWCNEIFKLITHPTYCLFY